MWREENISSCPISLLFPQLPAGNVLVAQLLPPSPSAKDVVLLCGFGSKWQGQESGFILSSQNMLWVALAVADATCSFPPFSSLVGTGWWSNTALVLFCWALLTDLRIWSIQMSEIELRNRNSSVWGLCLLPLSSFVMIFSVFFLGF